MNCQRIKYRTIDVSTVTGHDEAERLVRSGWRVVRPGMFSVVLASR